MTPGAPVGMHAAQAASWTFMVVAVAFCLGCLWWVVVQWHRRRDVLPALAMIGGAIASLEEPWIDAMIKLWYPKDAPLVAFTAFDTPQPLYLHLIYPGFVGLGSYFVYRGLVRRGDARPLWIGFVAIALLDLVFELPATAAHVFSYYGPQPLQPFGRGWPAWVAPINGAGPVLGGWLLYRLEPGLRERGRWMTALLPPLAYAGVYGATGWPVFTMLNSDVPAVARVGAAVVCASLCVALLRVLPVGSVGAPIAPKGEEPVDRPSAGLTADSGRRTIVASGQPS